MACLIVFQEWENAHVHDYIASNGTLKNRRWSEGSTTIKHYDSDGNAVYFLTYSANKSVSLPFLYIDDSVHRLIGSSYCSFL